LLPLAFFGLLAGAHGLTLVEQDRGEAHDECAQYHAGNNLAIHGAWLEMMRLLGLARLSLVCIIGAGDPGLESDSSNYFSQHNNQSILYETRTL
jgi:hypothetical protein